MSLKIIFAGTPAFAVPSLQALVESEHEVVTVYTQPDRPAGRGRGLQASPVKQCALEHGITVKQPLNFKSSEAIQTLEAYGADLMVVVAYGLLLPQAVLDAPRLGCINIHASLLPRWRGAAPIHHAILHGDAETGITMMQMDAGLDTGPILSQVKLSIQADETTASLHDRLSELGAQACLEVLEPLEQGELAPQPQTETAATYAHKIRKEQARIDWGKPAQSLAREVRAYNPWPVSFFEYRGEILRVWKAEALEADTDATPGTLLQCTTEGLNVATNQGVLRILELQRPGKKKQAIGDFVQYFQ